MTRINTLSLLATSKEPPPSGVWAMAMTVLGFAFGAGSSATSEEGVRIARRRPVR